MPIDITREEAELIIRSLARSSVHGPTRTLCLKIEKAYPGIMVACCLKDMDERMTNE